MKNKTKGVIAGLAGLALLSGGATFALWTDTASLTGGTITNGNLDVAAIGTLAWRDVSTDRTDGPHAITNLATWRMVPGDVIEGTQGLGVALEGDNLVASLNVDTTGSTLPTGMTVTYDVLHGATVVANDVALGSDVALRLAAGTSGQGAGAPVNGVGTIVVNEVTVPTTANFSVVISASFSGAVTNQTATAAQTALSNIAVQLTQVRTGTAFTP